MTIPFSLSIAGQKTQEIVLPKALVTIGRSSHNDVQLMDPKISRFHCKIEQTSDGIVLFDLQSKNGCFVNGLRSDRATLKKGDVLKVGNSTLAFYSAALMATPKVNGTCEYQVQSWLESPDERTREFTFVRDSERPNSNVMGKFSNETTWLKTLFTYVGKAGNVFSLKRNHLIAIVLFFLAIILVSIKLVSPNFLSETVEETTDRSDTIQTPSLPDVNRTPPALSAEVRENALALSREANILFATGEFKEALALYKQALATDPGNILAKEGIAKTRAHLEKMAEICLEKGKLELKNFNYKGALSELENVVFILDDFKNHKLVQEANVLIQQARHKVSK